MALEYIFVSLFRQTEGPALLEPLVAAGREQHFGLRRPELFIHFRLFRKIFTLDYPIPCRENIYFSSDTDNPCTDVEMALCLLRIQCPCSRMWEQCWCVLAAAHAVLDAADCGHAPSLPDVHSQSGPGDQWPYITLCAATRGCLVSFSNRMSFVKEY